MIRRFRASTAASGKQGAHMNNLVRSIMMVTLAALALVGAAFVTRGAQPNPGASAAPQAAPQPAAPSGRAPQPTAPAGSAKATPAAKQPAAAASEAPIQDEPTVAPDSQQSEDNSVTFPADI
jgi:type IV secretory pathway VirB10-like protein